MQYIAVQSIKRQFSSVYHSDHTSYAILNVLSLKHCYSEKLSDRSHKLFRNRWFQLKNFVIVAEMAILAFFGLWNYVSAPCAGPTNNKNGNFCHFFPFFSHHLVSTIGNTNILRESHISITILWCSKFISLSIFCEGDLKHMFSCKWCSLTAQCLQQDGVFTRLNSKAFLDLLQTSLLRRLQAQTLPFWSSTNRQNSPVQ